MASAATSGAAVERSALREALRLLAAGERERERSRRRLFERERRRLFERERVRLRRLSRDLERLSRRLRERDREWLLLNFEK